MNKNELEALLKELESDRVEKTQSVSDFDKFSEAICAFSNDLPNSGKPGYLFIGATRAGLASGAVIDEQLLERLGGTRSEGNIQPLPTMNVQKWPLGGGEIAVVEVYPSDLPPVRFKGRVWIRVGPRRATATAAEERILSERRVDRAKTWDARPCRDAELSDLSTDLFTLTYLPNAVAKGTLDEDDRPLEDQLASLRFYDLKSGHPTNAGVVMFAMDPLSFFPGDYIQYVRYGGDSQADELLEELRFIGDLLDILSRLKRLASSVAEERPVARPDLGDRTVFSYPPKAMHEFFMNACIHRNYEDSTTPVLINHYSDRIEIQNPGGLYGDLTREVFPRATSYRNPTLAEAAKTLGFVNRFGRGIALAQESLRSNESRPAEFGFEQNFFLVTIWRKI